MITAATRRRTRSPFVCTAAAAGNAARRIVRRVAQAIPGLNLLDRYIARTLFIPVAAIAAALGLLMLLERALVLLAEMTALGMYARFFLPLMLRLVPYYLMQAIPAAFVAALILVIGRMATDQEWVTMAAAGVSPRRMVRPMVLIGLLLAAVTLGVSGWLEPVGRYGYRSMHVFAVSESRLRSLHSTAIYAPTRNAMLTADAIGGDRLHGVFLWLADDEGGELVATAPSGRVSTRERPSSLDFELNDGVLLTADNREVGFGALRGTQPLTSAASPRARGRDARELTLSELLARDPASLGRRARNERSAEIYGRIARSFSIVVLPWIVLPLLLTSRARRRWPAVAIIIMLVVAFYHGVNFTRNLAASGGVDVWRAAVLTAVLPVLAAMTIWRFGGGQRAFSPLQWLSNLQLFSRRSVEQHVARPVGPRHGLSNYLAWRLFAMTATVLASLVLLLQLVDLFERGEILVRSGTGLQGFAYYAWCRLPATLLQAMPISMLCGALLTWGRMRVTSELVAIQAAGISTFGILRRSLAVPLLMGMAMIAIAEFWVPVSQVAFSQWWEKLAPVEHDVAAGERRWFRMGDEIVSAAMADPRGDELAAPRIYRRDADGRLEERISAARAVWTGAEWRLQDAVSWRLTTAGTGPRPLAGFVWRTPLQPSQVRQFFAAPVPLSGRDAWAAQNAQVPVDRAHALYQTRILMTFTIAAAPLVMLLLTIALVVAPRREKRLAWGLFQCLACGLSFLVANGYCEVMGQAGDLEPWLAVLIAPLLFAGLGIELMLRAERQG
jgi:LPS export ABC transporter permease LptG